MKFDSNELLLLPIQSESSMQSYNFNILKYHILVKNVYYDIVIEIDDWSDREYYILLSHTCSINQVKVGRLVIEKRCKQSNLGPLLAHH